MVENIPLAIALAFFATFGFAGGATIQHSAVGQTVVKREQQTMSLAAMWRLIRNPRWLIGLLVTGLGAALHVVALMLGPVTVVQPVGILAVPWSILLEARMHRHKVPPRVWLWVLVTVSSLGMFTWLSSEHTTASVVISEQPLLIAIGIVGALAVVLALFGHSGPKAFRCLAWASAGSVMYGLSSSLIRVVGVWVTHDDWLHNPVFWTTAVVLVVSYGGGGWMIQQGYATGPAETVVGSMTTTDPFVAVMIGLFVLGEGSTLTPVVAVAMAVLGLIAILGVALLSHEHPEAVAQRAYVAQQAALAAQASGESGDASAPGDEVRQRTLEKE